MAFRPWQQPDATMHTVLKWTLLVLVLAPVMAMLHMAVNWRQIYSHLGLRDEVGLLITGLILVLSVVWWRRRTSGQVPRPKAHKHTLDN